MVVELRSASGFSTHFAMTLFCPFESILLHDRDEEVMPLFPEQAARRAAADRSVGTKVRSGSLEREFRLQQINLAT